MKFGSVFWQPPTNLGKQGVSLVTAGIRRFTPYLNNLRWSVLIAIGIVFIVAVAIMGAAISSFVRATEVEAWQGRQREAAGYAGQTVAEFLSGVEETLRIVGVIHPDYLAQQLDVMHTVLSNNPALLEMVVLDSSGEILASAYRDSPVLASQFTISQSNWFIQAREGENFLGNVQIATNSIPFIIMAIPTATGVVGARLSMQVLWDVVSAIRFGATGQAYVVDRRARIVAHTDPAVVLANTTLMNWPIILADGAASKIQTQQSYINFQGVPVVGATVAVEGTGWTVVVEVTQSEAHAVTRRATILLSIGLTLFGLIVMGVSTRVLVRFLFAPMQALEKGAQEIGKGNLTYQVPVIRSDEIGRVAIAFNEMAAGLRLQNQQLADKSRALATEVAERIEAENALQAAHDQLERRVAERTAELKRKTDELVRSNRELEQFAYIASHDLQEPLRKVQAFGDRLKGRYANMLDERGQDYIVRMQDASSRMQTLIDGLLSYSRVTTKGQPFESVDLGVVVRGVISDLETRIDEIGGRVVVEALPRVEADPLQMRQLFQNLIGNALKFHNVDRAPVVTISTVPSRSPSQQDEDAASSNGRTYALIRVADNGIGFEQQYAERIFQPFQRLHGRHEYEGTGMGLAIALKIVERHGGSITATSAPDRGAAFDITLHLAEDRQPDHDSEQVEARSETDGL